MNVSPTVWRLPHASPACGVLGILNVTPDSFSDGGSHHGAGEAVRAGLALARAGAVLVDVGGESTRPGALDVDEDEEMRRVLPVVHELARHHGVAVSIDTRKAVVAEAALAAGACVVNDVSGGADPRMFPVVAAHGCGYVIMHLRGTPRTMQASAEYHDVVTDVRDHLARRLDEAVAAGIDPARIVLDPGIGFAKTWVHNRDLLLGLPRLASLGRPLLVGVSRKSFIGAVTGTPPRDRGGGSVAAEALAVWHGASFLRSHDAAAAVQALAITRAIADGTAP
jgi:dihydropteroate synthase